MRLPDHGIELRRSEQMPPVRGDFGAGIELLRGALRRCGRGRIRRHSNNASPPARAGDENSAPPRSRTESAKQRKAAAQTRRSAWTARTMRLFRADIDIDQLPRDRR